MKPRSKHGGVGSRCSLGRRSLTQLSTASRSPKPRFRSKQFGTVLEQFVYSLSLFFRDTGLRRDDWTEELRGVQAVIGQFIETLTGIVSAGECLSRCCQHLTPVGGVVGSKE